jgi:hypothetical protein
MMVQTFCASCKLSFTYGDLVVPIETIIVATESYAVAEKTPNAQAIHINCLLKGE